MSVQLALHIGPRANFADDTAQIHAHLGEVLYMAATVTDTSADRYLAESLRRFCRSIELCDDYLRGYYGLKLTTSRVLAKLAHQHPQASRQSKPDAGLPLPDLKTVERLNEVATAKLSEIVRRSVAGERGWEGYEKAEVIAAKALLDTDVAKTSR